MLDGDEPGVSASLKIASDLAERVLVRILKVPVGRQPGQLSSDEIRRILS